MTRAELENLLTSDDVGDEHRRQLMLELLAVRDAELEAVPDYLLPLVQEDIREARTEEIKEAVSALRKELESKSDMDLLGRERLAMIRGAAIELCLLVYVEELRDLSDEKLALKSQGAK